MSKFTVRSDSGEMYGSRELGNWATAFVRRFDCFPLEYFNEDQWKTPGNGWVTKVKYRLTDAARATLREEEEEGGSEFVPPTVDSGEMHGSEGLGKWSAAFIAKHGFEPLEVRNKKEGYWVASGSGRFSGFEYRLTDKAREVLKQEEEDEPEQQDATVSLHLDNVFLQMRRSLTALGEARADAKRLMSERDSARDASIKHYGKVEELQKTASELLSERDKLAINMNSKWWLLKRLVTLLTVESKFISRLYHR